jgi:Amt family ammonium transporter
MQKACRAVAALALPLLALPMPIVFHSRVAVAASASAGVAWGQVNAVGPLLVVGAVLLVLVGVLLREARLVRSRNAERLSALANATFEAICISSQGHIIDGNDAFGRLLGCNIEDLKGRTLKDFVEPRDWERVSSHKDGDFGAPYEGTIRDINGHRIPIEVRAREITYRGAPARISALIDLRERKQAEAQIRHLAQHDPLTNLPNRALFNERLAEMVEETRARQSMSAVVVVDLDRFKDINDLYGHAAGDDVLREVADRLRAETRSSDMVARLGGDEFAILVSPITFATQAADLAHRLIARLSLSMTVAGGVSIRPGASIGVAICPRDGIEDVTLMTRADTALYHAKNNGRNRYAVFEKGMDAEIRRRQELEMHLEQAVDRDEFELYFQPRMDVQSARIVSYEALIRWHHPEKGMINPADFIPVAENSGRIIGIGEWAMRRACEIAVSDLDGCGISVNVSPMQFREKTFVDMVMRVIRDTGIGPERLEIEITESLLIDDDQRAIAMLDALKAHGVRVALDDFGTGYSSLGYLSRFPFDTIKIDRSFVDDMQSDENAMAIIETIIQLGRALDMSIVAEGVEDLQAMKVLTEKGCDEIQGFVLGRPLPLAQRVRAASPAIIDMVTSVHKAAATALDAKGLQDLLTARQDGDETDDASGRTGRHRVY